MSAPAILPKPSAALTRALGVLIALHGFAHLAGTSDTYEKASNGESVDYLAGAWTISDPTLLRAFGVLWAILGLAFVYAAAVTWIRRPDWPQVLAIVSAASLAVVGVALWSSVIGVAVDVALLAFALVRRSRP